MYKGEAEEHIIKISMLRCKTYQNAVTAPFDARCGLELSRFHDASPLLFSGLRSNFMDQS